MVKLANTHDSGSCVARLAGSSPVTRTKWVLHKSNFNIWRVVRVVEGAALEMLCTQVPRVRIPNSPPKNNRNLDTRLRLFSFYGIMKKRR